MNDDLRERVATTMHIGLDDACPNGPDDSERDHQLWVERVQEWADWVHEQYKPHLCTRSALNAEVADVLDKLILLAEEMGLEDTARERELCRDCFPTGMRGNYPPPVDLTPGAAA